MNSIREEIIRARSLFWTVALVAALLAFLAPQAYAEDAPAATRVRVIGEPGGLKLEVDGEDFMILGMNWGYMPIGENYNYDLWSQPDDFIEEVLAREMPMLKAMGVNAIRQYVGIPPRWVQHIYEEYGIYTMVNHLVARYGYTLDGVWVPAERIDYSNPRLREVLIEEVSGMV